jgi:hypothetical protein
VRTHPGYGSAASRACSAIPDGLPRQNGETMVAVDYFRNVRDALTLETHCAKKGYARALPLTLTTNHSAANAAVTAKTIQTMRG